MVNYTEMDEDIDDSIQPMTRKPKKLSCLVYALTFLSALSGFLFGYDTGVVSGALVLLKDEFQMSSIVQEIFVSITMGSAMLFSLVSGVTNDFFGRKVTILMASVTFLIGSTVLAFSHSIESLLIGRFIVGVGIGLSSGSVPMYIAECSPQHIRGRLISVNCLFITGGQFIACLICGAFSFDIKNGWRFMLGLAAIPAFVQLALFICMPESPRWLYMKGQVDKVRQVLTKIERDEERVEEELKDIRNSLRNEAEGTNFLTIVTILKTCHVRRALFIGVMLQLIQQSVGINTVMYYSATIIQMSGVGDPSKAIWLASLVASVNFIFTFVGFLLVDKIGRRKLVLISLLGTFFSLLVLGTGFLLSSINSPPVNFNATQPSTCSNYLNCGACLSDQSCGYCYSSDSHSHNGSCIPLPTHSNSFREYQANSNLLQQQNLPPKVPSQLQSILLKDDGWMECQNSTWQQASWKFATKFCPTQYAWMTIFGLILYLAFFAPGMGPIPWMVNSEIYPGWARGSGNSISSSANWLANLVVSLTFLTLTEQITTYGAFYLYAGLALFGLIFIFLLLPETKSRSLEEIENLFKGDLIIPCRADVEKYNTV